MNPDTPPPEVLHDVARVVASRITDTTRLPGGRHVGATRIRLDTGTVAVLKVMPRTHPRQLDELSRAHTVATHMRAHGYPTPAWQGVGATTGHVWLLTDYVDATPPPRLTPNLVDQLAAIVELQAGHATTDYDHWSYAWRVATAATPGGDQTPEQTQLRHAITALPTHSHAVRDLVRRLRHACTHAPAPPPPPDMVHADLNPGNILVRDDTVTAVVDIGNTGSGTRATDLVTIAWHTYDDRLDEPRHRLWNRILDLIGPQAATVLAATHILHQLEFHTRGENPDTVTGIVERGHHVLDELTALT